MSKKTTDVNNDATVMETEKTEKTAKKRTARPRKKSEAKEAAAPATQEEKTEVKADNNETSLQQQQQQQQIQSETKVEVKPETKTEPKAEPKPEPKAEPKPEPKAEPKPVKKIPQNLIIRDFTDLTNQSSRIPMLSDQQILSLTLEDATERNVILEAIIANVLDYDIVMSDTNIWLELLVGHTSSHSDPRVNARLMFERQLEFISKMMKKVGGKFMIMSETYEEVDRFATMQEPTNYKDADWEDEATCRNAAARLAKRLMLCQQKENRLRIEGIGSESHHASFADPAIIRRTVELFANGKKVLLLTNDASVAIRALGMCDDLQRVNNVDDKTWREVYEPQRPMVLTMDDLKLLDTFTRQYHFLLSAAGRSWMQDVKMREQAVIEKPLELWLEGFRPGDRHESRSAVRERERKEQQERERKEREERERREREEREAEKAARREEQQRREAEKAARREEQQKREAEAAARREAAAKAKAEAEAAAKAKAKAETEAAVQPETNAKPETEEKPESQVETEVVVPAPSNEMMDLINEGNQPQKETKKRSTRRGGRRTAKKE